MAGPMLAAFVFLVGLTVAGVAASLMQLATGRPVGFVAPYVCRTQIARSLLATIAAGPMMLGNEALVACQEKRIGRMALLLALGISYLWACAIGIVVVEVASRMNAPLP